MVKKIIKRDGRRKVFDPQKIENAIYKAQLACGQDDLSVVKTATEKLLNKLTQSMKQVFQLKTFKILLKMF